MIDYISVYGRYIFTRSLPYPADATYEFSFPVIALAMVSCISDGDDSDTGSIELVAGDKLPAFSVTMNDGRVVTHESLRGKVSFIVFFNTGCKDCRRELPVIQQIYEHHPHMPLIAISRAEDAASVAGYWQEQHFTFPYAAQEDRTVYHLFAKSGIPRIYVVDAELTIRSVFTDNPLAGYDELEAAINLSLIHISEPTRH